MSPSLAGKRSRDVEESEEPATDKRKDKSKPIDWRKVSTKTKIWFRKKDGSYHQEMIGNEYSSKAASSKHVRSGLEKVASSSAPYAKAVPARIALESI